MATRSTIGYVENGILFQTYCHWYGYISGVGSLLVNHYNSLEKIKELLSLGHISSLSETIEKTIFYHRDRNEPLEPPTTTIFHYNSQKDFQLEWYEEYDYIFFNNFWYVFSCYNEKWTMLTPNKVNAFK